MKALGTILAICLVLVIFLLGWMCREIREIVRDIRRDLKRRHR